MPDEISCTDSYKVFLLAIVSPLLDLHSSLKLDTGSAAHRGAYVSHSVSLDVVPLPGLLSEEEGGDAGDEATQQATLPQIIGCTIGLAGPTAKTKTTWTEMFQLNILLETSFLFKIFLLTYP